MFVPLGPPVPETVHAEKNGELCRGENGVFLSGDDEDDLDGEGGAERRRPYQLISARDPVPEDERAGEGDREPDQDRQRELAADRRRGERASHRERAGPRLGPGEINLAEAEEVDDHGRPET